MPAFMRDRIIRSYTLARTIPIAIPRTHRPFGPRARLHPLRGCSVRKVFGLLAVLSNEP